MSGQARRNSPRRPQAVGAGRRLAIWRQVTVACARLCAPVGRRRRRRRRPICVSARMSRNAPLAWILPAGRPVGRPTHWAPGSAGLVVLLRLEREKKREIGANRLLSVSNRLYNADLGPDLAQVCWG